MSADLLYERLTSAECEAISEHWARIMVNHARGVLGPEAAGVALRELFEDVQAWTDVEVRPEAGVADVVLPMRRVGGRPPVAKVTRYRVGSESLSVSELAARAGVDDRAMQKRLGRHPPERALAMGAAQARGDAGVARR